MSDDRKKIKIIEAELRQLSAQHLELVKKNRQEVKTHQQQKTFFQQLFGQPALLPDPELEEVNTQIADLKLQRSEYFKVIQANIYIS